MILYSPFGLEVSYSRLIYILIRLGHLATGRDVTHRHHAEVRIIRRGGFLERFARPLRTRRLSLEALSMAMLLFLSALLPYPACSPSNPGIQHQSFLASSASHFPSIVCKVRVSQIPLSSITATASVPQWAAARCAMQRLPPKHQMFLHLASTKTRILCPIWSRPHMSVLIQKRARDFGYPSWSFRYLVCARKKFPRITLLVGGVHRSFDDSTPPRRA